MTSTKKSILMLAGTAAVATIALADAAFAAGSTVNTVAQNIGNNVASLTTLISYAAYIMGGGLGVAGIMKIKGHTDNPGSVPLKDGVARLGAAGGLLTLPFILDAMQNTVGENSQVQIKNITKASGGAW